MLGLGRSSMRVMPSVASGRYSPGPGTVELLGEGIYEEIRPAVANCSPEWPDFLAIVSNKATVGARKRGGGDTTRRMPSGEVAGTPVNPNLKMKRPWAAGHLSVKNQTSQSEEPIDPGAG